MRLLSSSRRFSAFSLVVEGSMTSMRMARMGWKN